MMQHTSVQSKDIAIIGYDKKDALLEVAFRSGSVYQYQKVPELTYEDFLNSSSHGIFFRDRIKDQYAFTKIK